MTVRLRAGWLAVVFAGAAACAAPVRMAVHPGPMAPCRMGDGADRPPVLTWWQPIDADERRELDARCARVDPPLDMASNAGSGGPVTRLAVVTWNLHDGRGDVARVVADLRAGRIGGGRPDAVVLLLQEAVRGRDPGDLPAATDDGAEVRDVVEQVASLSMHLTYVPARPNDRAPLGADAADRGTAIVSSLPLHDAAAIELPIERQRRVAVAATVGGVTTSGRPWALRVVSAHLENRPGARRFWIRAGASRTRQAEALLEALGVAPHAPTSSPDADGLIVGGDFNTWLAREGALVRFRQAFPDWSDEDTRATMAMGWRLDHLFARLPPGARATHRRLDGRYGSDHHPVAAVVEMN